MREHREPALVDPVTGAAPRLAGLLHAAGQREAAVTHLKEAARRFAAVDANDHPHPEIWMLAEW